MSRWFLRHTAFLFVVIIGHWGGDAVASQPLMRSSPQGVIRFLDKLTGEVEDITLTKDGRVQRGRLKVEMTDCRFPVDNPTAGAVAHLNIFDKPDSKVLFEGWMLASSPALSALDDPRYDVWLISCVYEGV